MDGSHDRHSPEHIKAARAAQVAYAMKVIADSPSDPVARRRADEILVLDPADILNTVERRKNPVTF